MYFTQLVLKDHPIPQIKDQWWADGTPKVQDESIKPFKIEFSDEVCQKDNIEIVLNFKNVHLKNVGTV